jgi:hypothetical protein
MTKITATIVNKPLKATVVEQQLPARVRLPIHTVKVYESGRQGPKGDAGLTVKEVDERIRENTFIFKDLAGNIYGSGA